jgi:threonine/homoserine/homoserine lactone efflux protein
MSLHHHHAGRPMESPLVAISEIWRPLAALILASVVIMGSPGPSTISITAVGASFGIRRSLSYACGLIVGTIVVLLMVAAGVVAVIASIPYGARVLSGVSAAYICFLAFRIATAPPLDAQTKQVAAPAFFVGLVLAMANPKAYLAIAAVFAGTTVVAGNPGLDAMLKITLLSVMIVIIHLCWLLVGASLSHVLHDPVSSRVVNVSLATALVIMTAVALIN